MIKINVDAVKATAADIEQINRTIDNEYNDLRQAINRLERLWSGSASNAAVGKFRKIDDNFAVARTAVVNDMARFLRNVVGDNYVSTENVVTSAADQFK